MKQQAKDRRKALLCGAFAFLLALTYLLSMTSCSSGSGDYNYDKSESINGGMWDDYEYSAEAEMPSEDGSYDKNSGTGSLSSSADTDVGENDLAARKLIKNAELTVETREFDAFMATLEANIASAGAYISASSVSGNSFDTSRVRYAYITVRVPAETYAGFVSGVSAYGNVTYQTESVNDVTLTYVDTESRIKAYETEYATLLDILDKATSLDDVLVIQNRITEVTYQLEAYRSKLRTYDDLISYCTVRLTISEVVELTEVKPTPMTLGERMARGWSDTWEELGDGAEDFAVWFVSALPVIAIWAVIIVVCVLVIRRAIRRGKAKWKANQPEIQENKEPKDE